MYCIFDATGVCVNCGYVEAVKGIMRECGPPPSAIQRHSVAVPAKVNGPGTELKALLAGWPFRIVATADCKCTSRAAYMDAQGCDWCESPQGMTEIMGFLREAAEERGLPFVDIAARLLVKRAIHNARKAEARRAKEAEQAAAEGRPA
jgi:hypothetical protein